jgi:hypothetical protein
MDTAYDTLRDFAKTAEINDLLSKAHLSLPLATDEIDGFVASLDEDKS